MCRSPSLGRDSLLQGHQSRVHIFLTTPGRDLIIYICGVINLTLGAAVDVADAEKKTQPDLLVPPGVEPECAALEAAVLPAAPRGHRQTEDSQLNFFLTLV